MLGNLRDECGVEPFAVARPRASAFVGVTEVAALAGRELAHRVGEPDVHRVADDGIERRVFGGRDLVVPVDAGAFAVSTGEQPVEEMLRRRVHDDVGEVLAAHEVHVVDPQIGWHRFVADRAVRAFPLDNRGSAVSERIARAEKCQAVHPRRDEEIAVHAVVPGVAQTLPGSGVDVAKSDRWSVECRLDVVGAAHTQPGDDLGDRRLEIGH